MLTINEAAVRAGVARGTIYRWLKAGDLKRHRLRTRIRIDAAELDRLCSVKGPWEFCRQCGQDVWTENLDCKEEGCKWTK
jgi:excisionase family DNA binding protein